MLIVSFFHFGVHWKWGGKVRKAPAHLLKRDSRLFGNYFEKIKSINQLLRNPQVNRPGSEAGRPGMTKITSKKTTIVVKSRDNKVIPKQHPQKSKQPGTMEAALKTPRTARTARPVSATSGRWTMNMTIFLQYSIWTASFVIIKCWDTSIIKYNFSLNYDCTT